MSIMTELIISIVGGVITALVLESMGRGGGRDQIGSEARTQASRAGRESVLGGLVRVIIAIGGGLAIAMIGGRMLIQAGLIPRGQGGRLILLVAGTVLVWLLLSVGRRR